MLYCPVCSQRLQSHRCKPMRPVRLLYELCGLLLDSAKGAARHRPNEFLKDTMSQIADALERFRRGGELLSTATMGCAGQEADFKPTPEKWSVRQLVCHLADTQIVVAMRLRLILAEENPTLGFDQDAYEEPRSGSGRSQAIETFRDCAAKITS